MQALTADYRRNLLKLQMFNYSCSFTTPTKWNTAAIKILLLFEAGLLISFWGWGKLRHEIQRKWKLNMEAFTAEYGKSFWPHLLAFRSCIPGELRGGPQLREISYIYDPIYDITSGCRVAALFSSEAQRLKPQKPNSWVTLDYKQRKTRHDIPQNHAVEWKFLQLYGAWYSLPAVNTLNCGHRRFPHSIPLRKLYFDWWLL